MPRFHLRYQNHDLEIPPGEFVVGRSRDCQLAMEDPLVSRRHAAFRATADKLSVEDLGSRNGVKVNANKIAGRQDLMHGDVVTIGNADMVVSVSSEAPSMPLRKPAVTMTSEVSEGGTALSLLAGVVDKAFAMGRVDEAERILSNILNDTLAALQRGRTEGNGLTEGTRYALRLAAETSKPIWIDWVFQAHLAASKVLPTATVDELYTLVRRVRYPVTPALKNYINGMRAQADKLSPTERFALQRIEGLVRVLLA